MHAEPVPPPADAPPGEPAPAPRSGYAPGQTVPFRPAWTLSREIGRGGFGEVWLAEHEWKRERGAVKFCTHPGARGLLAAHEKNVIVRVMRHAGDHPQIVPLLDYDLSGDIPWLMYEYVDGGTLADALPGWRDLPPPKRLSRAVLTLYGIARALKRVHGLDPPIVHRDLKPANVMMPRGIPRVTDFGIGGSAAPGPAADALPTALTAMGTFRYASPEQLFGAPPHPRDDVYALGVIAYQMVLADPTAAPGTDAADVLREHRVPAELAALVVRSVEMDPDRRPQTAREWERLLKRWMPRAGSAPPAAATAAATPLSVAAPTREAPAAPAPSTAPRPEPPRGHTEPGRTAIRPPKKSDDVTAFCFTLPGVLLARPLGRPTDPWEPVADTPAAVELTPEKVYRLRVAKGVTGPELAGLDFLPWLVPLRELDLSGCEALTDAALAPLLLYPALTALDLSGCAGLTDAGVAHLRRLTALTDLSLRWCPRVTDAGVGRLKRMTALRGLDLMGCAELTDGGLAVVTRFPGLRHLNLRWCERLTDAALAHLHALPKLRTLNLSNCPGLTDAAVAALRAALPRCRVER